MYTVRYAWGLGRKQRVKRQQFYELAENPRQALAKEASRIFLPGHGKREEPKIFIKASASEANIDGFFQHHWAPPQLFGIIKGSGFLLVFLFSVSL